MRAGLLFAIAIMAIGAQFASAAELTRAEIAKLVVEGKIAPSFLVIGIGGPDIAVLVDGETVEMSEQADAEALQELAIGTEFEDRRVGIPAIDACRLPGGPVIETTLEDPDIAVGCEMNTDDFSPFVAMGTFHSVWQSGPAFNQAIRIGEVRRLDRNIVLRFGRRRNGDEHAN